MSGVTMIPAAPGWRAALFSEFAFDLMRGEGDLGDHEAASDADVLMVLDIAPVVAWVVTDQGMRPATPLACPKARRAAFQAWVARGMPWPPDPPGLVSAIAGAALRGRPR